MTTPTVHDIPHPNIYNVQPTSDLSKSRIFPTLPYSNETSKVFDGHIFQFSDLPDTDYATLCKLLVTVFPQVTIVLLSLEDFTAKISFQTSSQNKCLPSLGLLRNKVSLSFT